MVNEIYFDNASTTQVDTESIRVMNDIFNKDYGNPSSLSKKGIVAKGIIEDARKIISKSINASPAEIFFTSGATESNNWAIKGVLGNVLRKRIITSCVEHKSVLNVCRGIEVNGGDVFYLNVDNMGFVDPFLLEENIDENVGIVSVMFANNEIGTIMPIEEIGRICKRHRVLFHVDATAAYMREKIDVKKMNIDLMSLSSHKIHGPTGVGALYIRDGVDIDALFLGGGQEMKKRSGTENVAGIIGFAVAVKNFLRKDVLKILEIRNYIIREALEIKGVKLVGPFNERVCSNINLLVKDVDAESLVGLFNGLGIYVSAGSACSVNDENASHVLKSIGLNQKDSLSCFRISLGRYNTFDEANLFLKEFKRIVKFLRSW